MKPIQIGRTHHRGRGRIYLGLGVSGIALFWLAKKVGWLGVGSSGVIWPALVIGVGLAIAAGGMLGTHGIHRGKRIEHEGGGK